MPSDPADAPDAPVTPGPEGVTELVRQLLDVRVWVALDVDEQGRVLAGTDDLGSLQLVEIEPDGTRTALTDLPSRCTGRYLPGRRVVVQHDSGGDERMQLSVRDLARTWPPVTRPARIEDLERSCSRRTGKGCSDDAVDVDERVTWRLSAFTGCRG